MLRGIRESLGPFTDDRGRAFDHRHNAAEALTEDEPYEDEDDLWASFLDDSHDLAAHLLSLSVLPVVIVAAVLNSPCWLMVLVAIAATVVVAILHRRILLSPGLCNRGYQCIHQIVRAGRCAGCGYRLAELDADGDGFIVCPECGAAWRADRMSISRASGDAAARRAVRVSLRPAVRLPAFSVRVDHRGRPMNCALYRPPKRAKSEYAERCSTASREILNPVRAKGLLLMCALTAAAIVLVGRMAYIFAENLTGPLWPVLAYLPPIAFLLLAALLFHRGDSLVRRSAIEECTLAKGLCPSCWELLAGLPAEADGCTLCPECGAAWRLTSAASAPAPARHSRPSPAPAHSAAPTGQPNQSPGRNPGDHPRSTPSALKGRPN